MGKATILIADNDADFLKTRAEFLEKEGFRVVQAYSPQSARQIIVDGEIDLAILDIRLENDLDEKDFSGIILAKETDPYLPKIILTQYPSPEAYRESLKVQLSGLPAAVDTISKEAGAEALILAVRQALGPMRAWLMKVKEALEEIDEELNEDYENAQQQARAYYIVSLIVALIGVIIIFVGILLVYSERLDFGIASTISGVITEVIGYLFFRRADSANSRMDTYHRERLQGHRFEMLLEASEGLGSEKKRSKCRQVVVLRASLAWLGDPGQEKLEEK